LGIVGAIPTEASPWLEDNLWALEQCDAAPFMVGYIGNLHPEAPEFGEYLARYHKNPLYRGIRYGNVWKYDLVGQLENPKFIAGLKLMADADLVLDTANPRVNLLQAAVKASDKVPNLRVVIDHLPGFLPKPEEMAAYNAAMKEIHARPNIYVKLSQLNRMVNGQHVLASKEKLDMFLEVFGEDRVMFSIGWPGGGDTQVMKDTLQLTRDYFAPRGRAAAEKFFWRNSLNCFKWIKRTPAQKALV
jgi:predicted TIM-barrel fold metal-dependent hydrolase